MRKQEESRSAAEILNEDRGKERRAEERTLSTQQLESSHDTEQPEPRPGSKSSVVEGGIVVVVIVDLVELVSLDDGLEDGEEISEEVDVDEMGESSETFESGGEEGSSLGLLDDGEVEDEEMLESFGLLERGREDKGQRTGDEPERNATRRRM